MIGMSVRFKGGESHSGMIATTFLPGEVTNREVLSGAKISIVEAMLDVIRNAHMGSWGVTERPHHDSLSIRKPQYEA
eukprot:10846326-Karenia_brevis.AAC.1